DLSCCPPDSSTRPHADPLPVGYRLTLVDTDGLKPGPTLHVLATKARLTTPTDIAFGCKRTAPLPQIPCSPAILFLPSDPSFPHKFVKSNQSLWWLRWHSSCSFPKPAVHTHL